MVYTFNMKTVFMQEILNVKKLTSGGTGDTLATILAIIVIIFIIIRFIDISYRKNILEKALDLYIPETLTEWEIEISVSPEGILAKGCFSQLYMMIR